MAYEAGSGICGTVKLRTKGIPIYSQDKNGEITTYHDVCILGVKWMDKRVMAAFCTINDNSIVKFQRHTNTSREGVESIRSQQSFTITIPTWEVLTRWI